MFDIFRKSFTLVTPISGKVIPLSEVPDPVFAQKMAGDGVAIDSTGDVIKAPADGKLSLFFKTNHAIGMTLPNGIELLIHVGIDTVKLNGEGFERLADEGQDVKCGDALLIINREFITLQGYSLVTPMLITNTDILKNIKYKTGFNAVAGSNVVLSYTIK